MRPTFLYPETLSEAVQMLAEYGQRACLIVGSESPPPGMSPADVFIDIGHLAELAGIHQLGGKVIVGANTPHSLVARSSLIRTHGACLAEASEEAHHPFASVLAYDFHPAEGFPATVLALFALDAEIESAWLDGDGGEQRRWSPIDALWNPAIIWETRLALVVRFSAGGRPSGSALITVNPPPGTDAFIQAAAARLTLSPDQRIITDAKIAVSPTIGAPFASPTAAARLLGETPTPATIEQAAQTALAEARVHFSPAALLTSTYPIDLVAHLTRRALDKALARALNKASAARL
ncbi:MAG TPA: hypothetical protein G4N94_01460 [Caldilineae bacterium]|nr:hypothetical protein [Caldilineae bacterium]